MLGVTINVRGIVEVLDVKIMRTVTNGQDLPLPRTHAVNRLSCIQSIHHRFHSAITLIVGILGVIKLRAL